MTNHPNRKSSLLDANRSNLTKAFLAAARDYTELMPKLGQIGLEALVHTARHRQLDPINRSDVLHRFYDFLSPVSQKVFRRYTREHCRHWLAYRYDKLNGKGLPHFRIIPYTLVASEGFVMHADQGQIPPFQI